MKKTKTIQLQGKDYAQVKDRLQEFRTKNPNGLIDTTPTIQPDGQILFKARILTDKANQSSAEATGHAMGENKGTKAFEKLETIAVGRALALLGYGSDGEIASSEEMEEFEEYKKNKLVELLFESQEKLQSCATIEELSDVWASLPVEAKNSLTQIKDDMKIRLTKDDNKKV